MFGNILKNNKVRLTLFLSVVAVAVIISFLIAEQNAAKREIAALPTPQIQKYIESEFDIAVNWKSEISLPTTLPLYELQPAALSNTYIETLGKNLGFANPPTEINMETGSKVVIFETEDSYMQINPPQRQVEYKQVVNIEDAFTKNPDFEKAKQDALTFLVEKGFIANQDSMQADKAVLVSMYDEGEVENLPKNTLSVSFSQKAESYRVVGSSYEVGSAVVWFTPRGQVRRAYVDSVGAFQKASDIQIKSKEDIEKSLSIASLQSLDDGNLEILEVDPQQISKIEINSVEIVYLKEFDKTQRYLQPVFNLQGTAQLKTGKSIKAGLYMPARKN